ncbi:cytochrome P450 [Sphingomonas sp.]|uniref:cytochrome P450 n=1 Tax=Sphingomonas sp. TaxID=28214 RepID=UPI003D6D68F4
MTANYTEADYNHHSPEIAQDPYSFLAAVRGKCPLGHSNELGGFYFPTTYEGVKRVFAEYKTFSSADGAGLPDQLVRLLPVDLDPPSHTRWRRVLNRFFTQEAAEADRPRIQGLADELIDAFAARGNADLVNELTRPFLAMTTLPVLGVPLSDRQMLSEKLLWMVHHRLNDHDGWVQRYGEIAAYLTNLVAERRTATERRDDLLQCLIEEEFDGRMLTDTEGYQVLILALFGALDSTSSAMSGSLYHLGEHPEDKARLLSGEVPWAGAIEEFLRFTTPIQTLRRTTSKETELDGGLVPEGSFVLAINGAANRDPAKFPEPDKCIISRDARDHMSFGTGAHICIGRHYARVMIDICLKTVLRRIGDYRIEDGFQPDYTASEARALKTLPVVFTPAAAPVG